MTDDWFADANRLFQPTPAVWKEGVFDDNGKWMDGWESRRKRFEGYDSAVIRLGAPGSIKGVDIDTSFFTGNFPPSASLEACFLASGEPDDSTQWVEVLSAVELQGNSHHYHAINHDQAFSHLRFNIYPDGGVARLRVYGVPFRDWSAVGDNEQVDLAAAPERRSRPGLFRRTLRPHGQHPQPGPWHQHGRRLGNRPASHARQ